MIVTDKVWYTKGGELRRGYNINRLLAENLSGVPAHLHKDWDCIGIISGRNRVRIGKSSMAFQCAYFVAWLLAGGEMCVDESSPDYGKILKKPNKKVKFDLGHVVFDPNDLMKLGNELPTQSVIVYDEGRAGLESKSTMMSINRMVEDFMQECGQYNHFLLIVLPDFFTLNKNFATDRSMFLIDVFTDDNYRRGFFNFFSVKKKERLYSFGRKLLGSTSRYNATQPDFFGSFSKWIPFDKDDYAALKKKALDKKRLSAKDIRISKQRDILIYLYKNTGNFSLRELSEEIKEEFGVVIGKDVIQRACINALGIKEKKSYMDDEDN